MGVELRVRRAGVVVIERAGDHPGDGHPRDPTAPDPGGRDALLQHGHRVAQRRVMGLRKQRLRPGVGDAPHYAERLRRRERQIEACNRGARLLRNLFLTDALDGFLPLRTGQRRIQPRNPRRNPLPRGKQPRIRRPELLAGHRMHALAEQPGEVLLGHRVAVRERWTLAGVETGQARAKPRSWRTAGLGVVPGQRSAHVPVAVARGD